MGENANGSIKPIG